MPETKHKLSVNHRSILDNMSTAVILLDDRMNIQYLNPAAENLFHISYQRAQELTLDKIMFLDHPFTDRLKLAVTELQPYSEHATQITLGPNRSITVDYMLSPLQLSDNETQLLFEISPIDRHLRIAREEKLLSEHQATRNLVRGMAHEIKNPLGGLRGAAQLLERELDSDRLKDYTRIIIGEADRLQTLVDRILGPNNLPRKTEVNIHQVLEHVRHLVNAEISKNISIKFDYDPSLPEIYADPDLLIQVVLNITRNAVAALDGHGEILFRTRPQRHFTIGHVYHKLVLQTEIIDNGPGIPEELLEQIFFPMVTGRADGTGLGLSIAQSLINQHGGLIEVNSRPGRTVFTIYLPLELKNA